MSGSDPSSGYGNSEGNNPDVYFAAQSAKDLASTCYAKVNPFIIPLMPTTILISLSQIGNFITENTEEALRVIVIA